MSKRGAQHHFGRNLRALLESLGITQAEFAARTGITQGAVSMILSGDRDPSLETVIRILKVIPVKFEMLIRAPEGR